MVNAIHSYFVKLYHVLSLSYHSSSFIHPGFQQYWAAPTLPLFQLLCICCFLYIEYSHTHFRWLLKCYLFREVVQACHELTYKTATPIPWILFFPKPALFFIVIINIQLQNSFIHLFIYFPQLEQEVPLNISLIWFFIRNKSLSLDIKIILMSIERTPEILNYMDRSKLQKLYMLHGEIPPIFT